MKVLMLGWEFPPYQSGGLGTACYGLTKGLAQEGVDVTFVMPHVDGDVDADFVHLIGTKGKKVRLRGIRSALRPYITAEGYTNELHHIEIFKKPGAKQVYGRNLYEEVHNFTRAARKIAEEEPHDVIHAHDWMTYKAAIEAREISGKPFVAHIHATEFDRTGGNNPNPYISHVEYEGLQAADLIIANSEYTKSNIIRHYSVDPKKVKVVYFGIDPDVPQYSMNFRSPLNQRDKIVLFLGRVTLQKGPDYFIEAAANVLNYKKNVRFIIAGSGDMLPRVINRAAELGIADRVTFTGFLEGEEVHKAFQMADVYVMPSVSEPYGLVALEAMKNKTPIIISKQSGVSEVLHHALKVDFWDIDEMTNKIVSVLNYQELFEELKDRGGEEIERFTLDGPARQTIDVYNEAIARYDKEAR